MRKEAIMVGIIGLFAGIIMTGSVAGYSINHGYSGMMRAMGVSRSNVDSIDMSMHANTTVNDSSMTMSGMVSSLKGKSGDAFDKAFITEMIAHHQGAIDMAKLAQQNAARDEIKTLAGNVITAQASEIDQMKAWQLQWGYATSSNQSGTMNMMQ